MFFQNRVSGEQAEVDKTIQIIKIQSTFNRTFFNQNIISSSPLMCKPICEVSSLSSKQFVLIAQIQNDQPIESYVSISCHVEIWGI